MAIVEILPTTRMRILPTVRPRISDDPTTYTRASPPKNLAEIKIGPIVIEQRESGDLVIYTRSTLAETSRSNECDVTIKREAGSETNRILIKNADVQDLMVALDGVLGNQPSKLTR